MEFHVENTRLHSTLLEKRLSVNGCVWISGAHMHSSICFIVTIYLGTFVTIYVTNVPRDLCFFVPRDLCPGTFAFFAQGWCKRRRRCQIVCLDFGGSPAFHSNFPRNLSFIKTFHQISLLAETLAGADVDSNAKNADSGNGA